MALTQSSGPPKRDQCEVAIAGGGPAGSLAAIHLARAGFGVVLFEPSRSADESDRGDFLSHEALACLRDVGVDPVSLGGQEISGFRLHGPTQTAFLRWRHAGVSLSQRVLDEELLRLASEAGVRVRRGVGVSEVLDGLDDFGSSILISTTEGEMRASRLIVAAGIGDFCSINERTGRDNSMVDFKMNLWLKPSSTRDLGASCDLFSFKGGYGSFTPLADGTATLTLILSRATVHGLATDWDSLTSWMGRSNWAVSHLLDGAKPQAKYFSSQGARPFGFLRRDPPPPGVFFVGNQMAVVPSVTGDGLTIALMTARLAVTAMMEERGYLRRLRFAPEASRCYQRAANVALRSLIETSMARHSLLKNLKLVDATAYALRAFPAVFERIFRPTLHHFAKPSRRARLLTWPQPAVQVEPVQS